MTVGTETIDDGSRLCATPGIAAKRLRPPPPSGCRARVTVLQDPDYPPRRGPQQIIHTSASTEPLFPGESTKIQFQRLDDAKARGDVWYVVADDVVKQCDDFEVRVDIYTDGAVPSTSSKLFKDLHNF